MNYVLPVGVHGFPKGSRCLAIEYAHAPILVFNRFATQGSHVLIHVQQTHVHQPADERACRTSGRIRKGQHGIDNRRNGRMFGVCERVGIPFRCVGQFVPQFICVHRRRLGSV